MGAHYWQGLALCSRFESYAAILYDTNFTDLTDLRATIQAALF